MAWSTRQLAELAGLATSTIRYYHRQGLLEEPERKPNGYKLYGIRHLISVLNVQRLSELGVPAVQIADIQNGKLAEPDLAAVDADLATRIARLQAIRDDISVVLAHRAPTDLPAGFSDVAADLTEADRTMVMVCSRVFRPEEIRKLLRLSRTPAKREFDSLRPDVPEAARRQLVAHLHETCRRAWREMSSAPECRTTGSGDAGPLSRFITDAMAETYNSAQVDVLHRLLRMLATGSPRREQNRGGRDSRFSAPGPSRRRPDAVPRRPA